MMRMINVIPRFDVAFRPLPRRLDTFFNNWVIPTSSIDECDWMPPSDN